MSLHVTVLCQISFELFPTNIQGDWSNIFRFAFNSTDIGIGDRAPGVWFTPGNLKLHWRYSTDTDPNWGEAKHLIKAGIFSITSMIPQGMMQWTLL